jgi:hypothetical protein
MKCTDCSKEIKPVVAIDIDGTMGMYHRHFLVYAANYLGRRFQDHYVGSQPFKEWFCSNYNVGTDVWHDIKLAYRQGSLKRTMPVYSDARFLCENIKAQGAELWVTTTRPYIRHDNIDPDTREWLSRNLIPFDYLIYDGNKYQKLAALVGTERVAAVLDDLIEEIDIAAKLFGHDAAILRKNEFNKAIRTTTTPIANTLPMAERIIRFRIREWVLKYGDAADTVRHNGEQNPAGSGDEVQGEVK